MTANPARSRARLLAPLAALAALAACATATPYQPLRGSSGGYSSQQIEANRHRVTFVGNQYTSRERVENYLLFRAAELTLQNGFDSFTIVRRDTERDLDVRTSPGIPSYGRYGYWRPYWRYYGRFGWRSYDPWFGDPFFDRTVDVDLIERYEATAEILMTRGTRPNDPMSFDARQVIANLGPTIQLPR